MNSREQVLGRIRQAIADSPAPDPVPREYARTGTLPPGSQAAIDLLVDRLEDYKARVTVIDDADLPVTVAEHLEPAQSVVIAPGLEDRIAAAAGGNGRRVTIDADPDPLSAHQLDAIDAVLTTARVAIAVTGTIILDGSEGQGRRAISLVPDRHLVVLRADQVVESVPEGIGRLTPTAPLTMISGPSATSDIELSRVEGVHGPRTLDVLIVR